MTVVHFDKSCMNITETEGPNCIEETGTFESIQKDQPSKMPIQLKEFLQSVNQKKHKTSDTSNQGMKYKDF